jgi:hypothetical protein
MLPQSKPCSLNVVVKRLQEPILSPSNKTDFKPLTLVGIQACWLDDDDDGELSTTRKRCGMRLQFAVR